MFGRTCLAALLFAAASAAQAESPQDASGYLTSPGGQIVTDAFGLCWHTGEWQAGMHYDHCEPRAVKTAAAPALQKPAPTPAKPEIVVKAPAPKPVPFALSTDALFDFDSASLKPEGRAELEKLAKQILGENYRTVDVTGHTDRIGAPGYNRHLSQHRAQAISDYLAAQGIDARKVHTQGVGSSEPRTASGQCDGLRRGERIQCLQPDRYAEVDVHGTQLSAQR